MFYELSVIERETHPLQIENAFLQSRENNNKKAHYDTLEKFKTLFVKELHRIKISMQNHKIENPEEVFTRYTAVNYKGLVEILNKKSSAAPHGTEKAPGTTVQNLLFQIKEQLQTLFIKPLKNFIETNFKNELIKSHLIDSPVDTFLKAIKNNKVSVVRHEQYVTEEYKSIYSTHANRLFTLHYNNFKIEALYDEYMENAFQEFFTYVESVLENIPAYVNKVKCLNKLKIKISCIKDFFFKEQEALNGHSRPNHFRKDVCDNLKLELHEYHIPDDFKKFSSALTPFTEIQKIYITKSLKFIKHQLNLAKISKQENQMGYHENQVPSNQLSLPLNDCPEPPEKLQWRGNINQLITFFYDASTQVLLDGEPILKASRKQLVRFLSENFIQKDGDPINPETIKAILTPSKELKRPPVHKRITIPLYKK